MANDATEKNTWASNKEQSVNYDVIIVGGGPGGLAAALTLGRARKRVLLCDSGPKRNATATHLHNFVTRDGTPPADFRRVGRQQLETYPNVEVRDVRLPSISGSIGSFQVMLPGGTVSAKRILLCTGMVDEMLPIAGFEELWGQQIFQCPYCHGWEVRDQRWGYLVSPRDAQMIVPFALLARGWTDDVVVFTGGHVELAEPSRLRLERAGIKIETAPVTGLSVSKGRLEAVELSDNTSVGRDVLFAHPPQRQVPLVESLGVALNAHGFVQIEGSDSETSVMGIYAAGDLTSPMQGAILAAAAGTRAASMINHELSMEFGVVSSPKERTVSHPEHSHDHTHHATHGVFANADHWSKTFDDPERDKWQQPDRVLRALQLGPTMTVADVGAGTGYFSVRLARAVPRGNVLATDIEPDMVRYISERARGEGLANLQATCATETASGLKHASVDRILVVHVWHHIGNRPSSSQDLFAALKPGGKLFVVDFKTDAERGPPEGMRISPEAIVAELRMAGFSAKLSSTEIPDQYIVEASVE